MTYRKARAKLGSRVHRRAGTKTKCIPGTGGAKNIPNKYKTHRHSKGKMRNSAKVALLVRGGTL